MKAWETHLDERQLKEVAFAREYAAHYAHGTDGHHRLLLITKLAELLDMGLVPHIVKEHDPTKLLNPRKPAPIRD